jgi:Zn-finger in ubiquitin-hydrolases and other protein
MGRITTMFNSGHVGCCDSSVELHATKHFVNTRHPDMVALLNKPWKW